MKNKKLTYILLPLVVIIWGLVVYRIFFEGKAKPENISTLTKPVIKESSEEEKNTYKLIANYRDPFLNNIKQPDTKIEENKKEIDKEANTSLRRRRNNISRVRWPEILYNGYVEGDINHEVTILINTGNKDYLVKEGDFIDQVLIKEFYGDSLLVVYKEEEKILKR